MFGFYRTAVAVPVTHVADTEFNIKNIISCIISANKNSAALIVFPELSITGYSCGDLFHQSVLLKSAEKSLFEIAKETKNLDIISIVGLALQHNNSIYNCAAVVQQGKILGIVPKINLPNYKEFYEKRWFSPYGMTFKPETIELSNNSIPFGTNIIFEFNNEFKFAVEICEDLWSTIPPSSFHVLAGANIIANPSASNELVTKAEYRHDLIKNQSARCICGYLYASSGVGESSSDVLYGGHTSIAENGTILHENSRFQRENLISYADIDCQKLSAIRTLESTMEDSLSQLKLLLPNLKYQSIKIKKINQIKEIKRSFSPHPFIPSDPVLQDKRCSEIINIQASSLAKRIEHIKAKKTIIGISGGLDSTLALLVAVEANKLLGKSIKDIIAVTMPGFGTTKTTYGNAKMLCEIIGCDFREIDIKKTCKDQLEYLKLTTSTRNTVYENVQARQRMMLLMNIANNENGIVIGTGDLSEIALGWSTYNGDHMSMYAVNCGVPKTLVKYLINWYANKSNPTLKKILINITKTPISPELLPPDKNGKISQKTESIIGPFELHDFFLYHTIKYGACPDKVKALAKIAFKNRYNINTIEKYLNLFINRFFSQQFKRNCMPDGPKVGTIALSPRGDWRMPSDASPNIWLRELKNSKTF